MQNGQYITADEAKPGNAVLEGTRSALAAEEHSVCVTRLDLVWTLHTGWPNLLSTGCSALLPWAALHANVCWDAEGLLLARCFLASWGHAYFLLVRDNMSRELRFPKLDVSSLVSKSTQSLMVYY